jgi:hypothetical protein
MILNNAPQNEAVLSNVGEIGEFRIRNSAKAFNILSSGLYANKIRAIIRELSCNAVDSHVAAGRTETPFDVHLPNQLEPWFAIRDYGTGLSHEQVTNIYTTYFESTKTASNEFIGALGLGSKSPFSYTDNFTVTAIQNGKKGIYSAFINSDGVPSIALMMSEDTDEPAGVEIKFSVNERWDFDKFRQEAREVFTHFTLRPVISGNGDFGFKDVEYDNKDIVPGVHSYKSGRGRSIAVMGNIAYPIDIPATFDLEGLNTLLNCGLEMHFGIGELDFQASREGLSYIPQTVESIKRKLQLLNGALTTVLATEADAIANLWERAVFLNKKKDNPLWLAAVTKYVADTKLPTMVEDKYSSIRPTKFNFKIEDLASQYNIQIRCIHRSRGSKTVGTLKNETVYADNNAKDANGHYITWQVWGFTVDADTHFIVNDLKTGATERAKYHYRETDCTVYQRNVFVLDPVDRNKKMLTEAFFIAMYNPPVENILQASTLLQRERTSMGRDVTIMSLCKRGSGGYYRREDMVWRDAGKASAFDATQTYYYVPLSGFQMESAKGYGSGKDLYDDVKALPGLFSGDIYGVRKADIEDIKKRANWINLENHIAQLLNGKDISKLLMSLVRAKLDRDDVLNYTYDTLAMVSAASPYAKLLETFKNVEKFSGKTSNVERLFMRFAPGANISPIALTSKYQQEVNEVNSRYPLLTQLNSYRVKAGDIAEYVNLIDAKKGD